MTEERVAPGAKVMETGVLVVSEDDVPESATVYCFAVGVDNETGTGKVTRRVEPITVTTEVARTFTVRPLPGTTGDKVTVISPGAMVPAGKGEPVTLTLVRPGVAVEGVAEARFICAAKDPILANKIPATVKGRANAFTS